MQAQQASTFELLGTSHLAVLVVTVSLTVAMVLMARWHVRGLRLAEHLLAVAMLTSWPMKVLHAWSEGWLSADMALPLHYCDVATFACAIALWTRRSLPSEMAYYFGLSGMLQGLITPALRVDFPSWVFVSFFAYHAGGVVTAFYMVLGRRLCPREGAVLRMLGVSLVYFLIASAVNALLHTNYGFFCEKPPSPSLMDALGPWPWYVVALLGVAAVYYAVLDVPFVILRRRRKEMSLPSKSG